MSMLPQFNGNDAAAWRQKANQRIKFLEQFSEAPLRPSPRFAGDLPLAAAKALTSATELAFATDQPQLGCELMERTFALVSSMAIDRRPILRTSLLGGLLRRTKTTLQSGGVWLSDDGFNEAPWHGSTATLNRVAGTLIAAAACSKDWPNAFPLLTQKLGDLKDDRSRLAFLALTNTIEADALRALGFDRRPDGGLQPVGILIRPLTGAALAFVALHLRYATRLRLLASDGEHWQKLLPRAPLIDWALLGLHVAVLRNNPALLEFRESETSLILGTLSFVQGLAGHIAKRYS
jgi:hypothetical protein